MKCSKSLHWFQIDSLHISQFSANWNSKKPSSAGFFGGASGGDDGDEYNFEFEPKAKSKPARSSYSPDSFSSQTGKGFHQTEKAPASAPKSVAASTDSALDRANSMLAKYSGKASTVSSSMTRPLPTKKVPTEFDEDDIR